MKKILFYLMIIGFAFYGKSQENETNAGFKTPILPANYVKLDLSNIGLKATVIAPKQSETQKSYLDDNEGGRDYYLIYTFQILTGDSNLDKRGGIWAEIEILTTTWTLKQHKDRVKYSSIAGWHQFLKEDEDYFMYSASPANSWNQPLRAKDKDVYHFAILKKSQQDGKQYLIRSSSSFDLTKDQMLLLYAIARSVEL